MLHVYDSWEEPPVNCFFSCFKFTFVVQNFQLDMTCISSRGLMYFFVHMSNFILQNFEELDRVVRKSIILLKTQKMSKREQRKKIALVSQQISDLKDRVAKLESCLRTLEQDPDQYFQNLNPNN